MQSENILALDVGDKRIGVARANSLAKIAQSLTTISRDGGEFNKLIKILDEEEIKLIIIGRPRNMQGEETQQTIKVEKFVNSLKDSGINIATYYQDESLTSVNAEAELDRSKKNYSKADIDMEAARIILQDYLDGTT